MQLKSDLNKYISKVWLLYTNSYEHFNCLIQINEHKKNEFEDKRFKSFITYSCWYVLIIELSKVYHDSKSQHYNIYSLINKLLIQYLSLEYNALLPLTVIKKYQTNFYSPEIIEASRKLITLRNKFYAHTDKLENFINEIDITLVEIELLLKVLREFIFDIKIQVFNSHTLFDDDIFVDLETVLKSIEEYKAKNHSEIIQKFHKKC